MAVGATMNSECTCGAWALRIDREPWFQERAITYNCPEHGVVTIDDRQAGESEILMLTSPYAREDRETSQIALHMSRMFAYPDGWEGDAYLYHIDV